MDKTLAQKNSQRGKTLRLLRKIHGWLGLWGAILGLLFGVSGFLLNHRAVMKIPAAKMEETEIQLAMAMPLPQNQKDFVKAIQTAFDIKQDPVKPKNRGGNAEGGKQERGSMQRGEGGREGGRAREANPDREARAERRGDAEHNGKSERGGNSERSGNHDGGANPEREARFMDKTLAQPETLKASFQLPQASIQAEYVVGNRFATVKREDANVWAFISRMHKGVGANTAWVLLADSIAGAMLILSITGVLLWTKMRGSRLALVSFVGGSAIATVWATMSMM